MNKSLQDSTPDSQMKFGEDDEEQVDKLIYFNVCIPLSEAKQRMGKNDGPYMPMTVSLYRTVAFKMFKRKFANKQNLAPIYASFCQKVDRELLDKEFFFEIVK